METSGVLWEQTRAHPPEEVLERHSMDCAAEEECERVEKHLLLCASCRKQLDECDQWVTLMKAAAQLSLQEIAARSPPIWNRWGRTASGFVSRPAFAGSFAMLLAVLWIAPSPWTLRDSDAGQAPVSLSALRGNDLRVKVRAGRALDLKLEDGDGVSAATIVIVNADGDQVWSGTLQGNSAHVPSLKKASTG